MWLSVRLFSKITGDHTVYRTTGLEISVNSRIASPFSGQIANSNAGPTTTLQSIGAKQTFHGHFLNIGPTNK